MTGRVVRMVCPCCCGSGSSDFVIRGAAFVCGWCRGDGRVQTATALRYADHLFIIAGGGFIAGDHDLADMREIEAQAEAVYALAQIAPPWKAVAR